MVIPDRSFLTTVLWNFPGALVYHLLYLFTSMNHEFYSSLNGPKVIFPRTMRKTFPFLTHLKSYYGTILHEGQFNDCRQLIMSLLTSTVNNYEKGMKGANIANYVSFTDFIKNSEGKITGITAKDELTQTNFSINAKVVIN